MYTKTRKLAKMLSSCFQADEIHFVVVRKGTAPLKSKTPGPAYTEGAGGREGGNEQLDGTGAT